MLLESEWETRKKRIDSKLQNLNPPWKIISHHDGLDISQLDKVAVREFPTENGPADYALFVKGQFLGIIEAKKVSVGAANVLEQAKRYSKGAAKGPGNWDSYRVPFLYATNGEQIYFLDVRNKQNISRKLSSFHTSDALHESFHSDFAGSHQWLENNPVEIEGLREYQKKAIEAVEQAIRKGKRASLVAMATGTGKTFMTVAQIYRLLKSKTARRILFLVDRRVLAAQAVRAFSSFNTPTGSKFSHEYEVYSQQFRRDDLEEDDFNPSLLPSSYLISPKPSHTFVYVSTVQRMSINLFGKDADWLYSSEESDDESDAEKLDIPIHAFDLIIADECHRGYTAKETSKWRDTIDYFDAIKIGLTATPAPHSLNLFNEVVYRYTVDEAIRDGFLVDYDAVRINSNIRMNGVFLTEGEHVDIIDPETGVKTYDELEAEREFASEEIERKITAPDCNRKIVKEIFSYADEHRQKTGHFPKTLIFAVNDLHNVSHADQIVSMCREVFGQGESFVQKITGSPTVDRPLQKIREFRNRPEPVIVVTVDMLSTGVDIPAIEFIVMMRPIKSRILWVQMLGRGTRLCPEINKTHFTVFDCLDGSLIEYFRNTNDFALGLPQKDVVPIEKIIENIYNNTDKDYNIKILARRLQRIPKNMSGDAVEEFSRFIPNGDIGLFAKTLPSQIAKDFAKTMQLLRDKTFQDLLVNYPRARNIFLVAQEAQDCVSSEVMFKVGDTHLKPEDYLQAFTKFIQDNQDQVDAIKIIVSRPREWKTDVLEDLRKRLRGEWFDEDRLQKAHECVYHKHLADIISMVKHAAKQDEPLVSKEERITRAMERLSQGRDFNEEQLKWLDYIKGHLIENLTLDMADFDLMPVFSLQGGLGRARKVFKDGLEELVSEINYLVAA